jgi:hypothetical protein
MDVERCPGLLLRHIKQLPFFCCPEDSHLSSLPAAFSKWQ